MEEQEGWQEDLEERAGGGGALKLPFHYRETWQQREKDKSGSSANAAGASSFPTWEGGQLASALPLPEAAECRMKNCLGVGIREHQTLTWLGRRAKNRSLYLGCTKDSNPRWHGC